MQWHDSLTKIEHAIVHEIGRFLHSLQEESAQLVQNDNHYLGQTTKLNKKNGFVGQTD